jgi:hypothetical protein
MTTHPIPKRPARRPIVLGYLAPLDLPHPSALERCASGIRARNTPLDSTAALEKPDLQTAPYQLQIR